MDAAEKAPVTGRFALPRCQYGVVARGLPNEVDCGQPAVAKWVWCDGTLYVCKEHDLLVEQGEAEEE